ncbi:MAG: hypothetical protein BGO01_10875 [Armatimonadetes bacterium 55-13]|nr:hypothetical protein [Armatimonadota bacterium]OJU62894.1 MAG: hypothetical protein BGO01_10875 [Armatimonadetes bacterium 55-13]
MMQNEISGEHPIWMYFGKVVHEALKDCVGVTEEDVEVYITCLLVDFLHRDNVFAIRDRAGRTLQSIAEMLAEGDVRLNADSFDRERAVHRHIGDFLLFWSGLFPEFLRDMKLQDIRDCVLDVNRQAKESYHIASTFDHEPFAAEAKTFRKLSTQFESYQASLMLVRASFDGHGSASWHRGFDA